MIKHIILWTLNPELSEEEKENVKAAIKQDLEALVGVVPGLVEATVNIDGRLASSNADLMLDSTLESEEALKAYAVPIGLKSFSPRMRSSMRLVAAVMGSSPSTSSSKPLLSGMAIFFELCA